MRNKFSLKPIIILLLLIFVNVNSFAQKSNKVTDYSKKPYWIDMMKDPDVNYFEAIKAYNEFWAKREKPSEEDEIIGQDKSIENKGKLFSKLFKSKEQREKEEAKKYTLDVKKFEHWKMKVKPYVQEDGRILSADEQLKLWQQQKQ